VSVVHDGEATPIEQMLALTTGASTMSLPAAHMRQGVFDRHPLAHLCLALPHLLQKLERALSRKKAPRDG
jgi:hypothetical protein